MKNCPYCTNAYPDHAEACPVHGCKLNESDDLPPGKVIRDTYRIVRKLGDGSLGPVYLAEHVFIDEPRALKFLPRQLNGDEALNTRFRAELNALRQVRHQNVVISGDLQLAEDQTPFIAIEYVDGPDLRVLFDIAPDPFDVNLTLTIARCITEGLAAAHSCGLVHRDLKPKNILIAREADSWVPKITGFAVVAIKEKIASFRSAAQPVLSPAYAAPEQWFGTDPAELDGRTDLYALGGILYEMLTGQTPFYAENYEGWGVQHVNDQPPPPSALRPNLANWHGLDELILRLLDKDREARPRSAAELIPLLDLVQFGIPIPQPAPLPPPSEPLPEVVAETTIPAPGTPVAFAPPPQISVITNTNADTTTLAAEEPAPVAFPPAFSAPNDRFIADEPPASSFPIDRFNVNAPPAPSFPIDRFNVNEPQAFTDPRTIVEPAPIAVPPAIPSPEVLAEAAAEEPATVVAPAAPSTGEDTRNVTDEPSEKLDDYHAWLREYENRDTNHTTQSTGEPEPAEETQDIAIETAETLEDSAGWQSIFAGNDLIEGARQESGNSTQPVIPILSAEPPVELTDEQKELAELQRMFSNSHAASSEQKLGRTARFARFSPSANAGKEAEATGAKPAEPEISPAPVLPVNEPTPDKPKNTGDVQTLFAAANPTSTPQNPDTTVHDETTSERFSHPVWKVFAALAVLGAVAFGAWRFGYTDPKLPPKNMSQGCNAGDAKACFQLAGWYEQTNTLKDGDAKAITYYAKACDASLPLACRKLGFKYLFGKGIPIDKPRALPLFAKACDQRDYQGCDTLADLYHNGEGVTRDDAQAAQLYSKSCSLGEDFGCEWAARLTAASATATPVPPVHRPRPATTGANAATAPAPTPASASAAAPAPTPPPNK